MAELASRALIADPKPNQRRWRDLHKGRLALGLIAAPVLPVGIGGLLIWGLDPFGRFEGLIRFCAIVSAVAAGWSLVAGFAYLALRARRTGLIGRADCFLLGTLLAFSLPWAAEVAGLIIDAAMAQWSGETPFFGFGGPSRNVFGFGAILGLFLTPFGLLGGWIFWRLSVRPAIMPLPDFAAVFE